MTSIPEEDGDTKANATWDEAEPEEESKETSHLGDEVDPSHPLRPPELEDCGLLEEVESAWLEINSTWKKKWTTPMSFSKASYWLSPSLA